MGYDPVLTPDQSVHDYQREILHEFGHALSSASHILDFGCGIGRHTYEYLDRGFPHTCGFDIRDYLVLRKPEDRQRFFIGEEGRDSTIPIADDAFDFVFSTSTFEHVMEPERMYREVYRVLKPGGVFLNHFPSKWRPIEPHIFIPFGGAIRAYPYYLLWALLGVRRRSQRERGSSILETARGNHRYAYNGLNYLTFREIDRMLVRVFDRHRHVESSFIRHSPGRARRIRWVFSAFPFLVHLYRFAHTHVILMEKAPLRGETRSPRGGQPAGGRAAAGRVQP
jgi:SAM-dependent methyltransferase